jgi:hypothetical protein
MIKALLILATLVSLALAVFSNFGDVQLTVASGECANVVAPGERGKAFCESLNAGRFLWTVVLHASALAAALAGVALYLVWRGRR